MIRTLTGYAVIAVIGIVAIKLVLAVIGLAFSLLSTVLAFAAIGFVFYLILRIVNPEAAGRLREKIKRTRPDRRDDADTHDDDDETVTV